MRVPAANSLDAVLSRIVEWALADDHIRALVVTSTRARPEGPPDDLSDYDVIVATKDVRRFDPASAAGKRPAARWGDDTEVHRVRTFFRGVVYDDGTKIDWTLCPTSVVGLVAEHGLTDNLGVGYRVLVDKDGGTERWREPTFRAHMLAPPTEAEYVALVEEFWWSVTYVAKARARGEELASRAALDMDITHGVLRRVLEWRIELSRDWSWKPGAIGCGIERALPADLAEGLHASYGSLERTAALFRRVAGEVGDGLGFEYPQYADDAVRAYVDRLARC